MEKKIVIKKISAVIEEITSLNRSLFTEGEQTNQLTIDYLRTNTQYLLQLLELVSSQSNIHPAETVSKEIHLKETPAPAPVFVPEPIIDTPKAAPVFVPEPVPTPVMVEEKSLVTAPVATPATDKNKKAIQTFIGLNDRILLIKELFEGNKELYDTLLDSLNTLADATEADQAITTYSKGKTSWKEQEDLVNYLRYVVKRRFNG